MSQKYTDILANAFNEVRAWKLATLLVTALCALLAISLVWQASSTPVVLVPYGLASEQGRVTVQPGGGFDGTSPDYLGQIALGDLALGLNWQPDNIDRQTARLFNRMTNELYTAVSGELEAQAKSYRSRDITQSFYPEEVKVDVQQGKVIVRGFLVQWIGGAESAREKVTYTLTYRQEKGFLHLAGFTHDKN